MAADTRTQKLSDAEIDRMLRTFLSKKNTFHVLGTSFFVLSKISFGIIILLAIIYFLTPNVDQFISTAFTFAFVSGISFGGSFFIGIGFFLVMSMYGKKADAFVSRHVVRSMLERNFDLNSYNPDRSIAGDRLRKSQIESWDKSRGSCLFQAKYKGVSFMFSNVCLIHISKEILDSDHTIFEGPWLIIDLDRTIDSPIIFCELNYKKFLTPIIIKAMKDKSKFDNRFTIVRHGKHDPSVVLTPRLKELIVPSTIITSYKSYLSFTENSAHIAISTLSTFFSPVSKDVAEVRKGIQVELDLIKSIIDELLQNKCFFNPEQAQDV